MKRYDEMMKYLKNKVACNDLPAAALRDQNYLTKVLKKYIVYSDNFDAGVYGDGIMHRYECLDMAYNEVEYK